MGVDLAVKQVVQIVRGRRQVLKWLGAPPKERGRIRKFFFRIGMTNKWTRIVLSYKVGFRRLLYLQDFCRFLLGKIIPCVGRSTQDQRRCSGQSTRRFLSVTVRCNLLIVESGRGVLGRHPAIVVLCLNLFRPSVRDMERYPEFVRVV